DTYRCRRETFSTSHALSCHGPDVPPMLQRDAKKFQTAPSEQCAPSPLERMSSGCATSPPRCRPGERASNRSNVRDLYRDPYFELLKRRNSSHSDVLIS